MHEQVAVPATSDVPEVTFAGFQLKADGTLLRGDAEVHLPPKELAALKLMVAHAGRIVTPQELRLALWGDVHVTEDSIPRCVSSLRARLQPEECIQTVYKRGYRFIAEVRTLRDGASQGLPRLAILPFASGNGVPDYLGTVIAEETMMRLSRLRPAAISVLAQDSVFTLARRRLTAQQIGTMLNADLVLAGSLNALPLHYRLRAEMIRIRDGVQIWVEDVLVDRSRIAGLETELALRLAFRLGTAFAAGHFSTSAIALHDGSDLHAAQSRTEEFSISAASQPQSEILEAYEIFQRAHHEWQSLQRHRMQDGLQHLLRATELYPSLMGARIDLVNLCVTQCFYGFMSPAMEADIARRTVEPVSDLLSRAEAVLPSLAWISFHVDRNLPEALRLFSASAHLPHNSWTTRARSMFALSRHRFDQAIELLRKAILQDPYAPWLHARLAWSLHLAGEPRESLKQVHSALTQFPDHEGVHLYSSIILAFNGDTEHAIRLTSDLAQHLPHFDPASSAHAYALSRGGRQDQARAVLERLQWMGRERYLLRSFLPAVYVALGEQDAAITELRASEENCCPWFLQALADPRLKALHSHPEFERMRSTLTTMEAAGALQAELID